MARPGSRTTRFLPFGFSSPAFRVLGRDRVAEYSLEEGSGRTDGAGGYLTPGSDVSADADSCVLLGLDGELPGR